MRRRNRIDVAPAEEAAAHGLTRGEFVRRAAGSGAGLVLGGGAGLVAADAAPAATNAAVQTFHTEPHLTPPRLTIVKRPPKDIADGFVFLAPSSGPGQRGALIIDDAGEVVWFRPTTPHTAMNFRTATYKGEPVLTWWEGKTTDGLGSGHHVIVDRAYREVARFGAGNGRQSDLHEFLITSRNTALVTSYEMRTMDLSAFGGEAAGTVVGGIVQELEIPSARVLFEWRSLDHVPLEESHATAGHNFLDYFHINSIDIDGDGDLLISARNTWAVYKIGRKSGDIAWRLGGKQSDFTMGEGTNFAWQHDARHHGGGRRLTIFDDGGAPTVEPQSRALLLALDLKGRRATLVHQYAHHPGRLQSHFMGNAQALDNGNVVVGWGSEPYVTEFDAAGSIRFEAKLPRGGQNYRAFRLPWEGRPAAKPKLVAHRKAGMINAYVSWNGATEVASWELRTGETAGNLDTVAATGPKTGFETTLTIDQGARYGAAVALGAHGKELGRSLAVRL
jgi:Arylsulfotransferase (ASST)